MEICNRCFEAKVSCGSDSYTIAGLNPDTAYWVILTDRFGNKYRLGAPNESDETVTDNLGVFIFSMPDGMDDPHAGAVTINIYTDAELCDLFTLTICLVDYTCISLSFYKMTSYSKSTLICNCCEQPCITVDSVDDLPDYRLCQMAIVRDIRDATWNVSIWQYIEGAWTSVAQVFENFVDGEIPSAEYSTITGWSVSIESAAAVSGDGSIAFDPPLTDIDITFINGSCTYTMPLIAYSCPVICLTVADPSELPDPPTGCEFALLSVSSPITPAYALAQWNGASWDFVVTVGAVINDGEISYADYTTTGSWVMTLNGVEVSGNDSYFFDPGTVSLDVIFVNGQCSYVMDQIVPPASIPLAFTYYMDRDIAVNDTVGMILSFSAIGQTGTIDWGDGVTEPFDTGAGVILITDHLFSNSGLNEIKVYCADGSLLTYVLVANDGLAGTQGGENIVFEAVVTNLATLQLGDSSITTLPPTIPTTITNLSLNDNLLTSADLSAYTNLTNVNINNNSLTSIDLTGLVNLAVISLQNNTGLGTFTIPDFSNITQIAVDNCAIPTATIEAFLDGCDGNGLEDGFFDSQNQTPPAPVTGYPAYASLAGKNWTLNTD